MIHTTASVKRRTSVPSLVVAAGTVDVQTGTNYEGRKNGVLYSRGWEEGIY